MQKKKHRFLSRFHPEIKKLCIVRDYANMDELLSTVLEVERVLAKLKETPFELMKDEQEEGLTTNVVVDKKVSALNESLINFFRQGITPSHGTRSPSISTVPICQI